MRGCARAGDRETLSLARGLADDLPFGSNMKVPNCKEVGTTKASIPLLLILSGCGFGRGGDTSGETGAGGASFEAPLQLPPPLPVEGSACGDCAAGVIAQGACRYPTFDVDEEFGLAPADIGDRAAFDPDDFLGSDYWKVNQASKAASEVGGAVVMHRVFETDQQIWAYPGVMYTGGGLRRMCAPSVHAVEAADATQRCVRVDYAPWLSPGQLVAVTTGSATRDTIGLISLSETTPDSICSYEPFGFEVPVGAGIVRTNTLLAEPNYDAGIIVDSVLFDGAYRCNNGTNDWRLNNALSLRGNNVVRNSVFYDSPSESITTCGARIEHNRAFLLQGSFVHKSCGMDPEPLDILSDNYVDGVNLAGNEQMNHSAGLVTLSVNAGTINLYNNVFRNGREGVYGYASANTEEIHAFNECYAHFKRGIILYDNANPERFTFEAEVVDIPEFFAPFVAWP